VKIPLEDNFNDVLGKAQRGLGMSDEALARTAGISVDELARLKGGSFIEEPARKLCPILKLKGEALSRLARKEYYPSDNAPVDGLMAFNTAFEDMTVNAYLVWDPKTSQAACFDTGADCSEMIKFAEEKKLRVQLILLTHTHPDHIADLERLKLATGAAAFVCKLEAIPAVETFEAGKRFVLGTLQIETRQTSGHSRGGITYVIAGLARPVAVVGDSMFAGSMGGGGVSYADALKNNREKILSLPDATILCPGHGPLTTVAQERQNNPFFP
jgi:glyoxylase-like metal-dependent hydrolase (beta-lactamase superfamily II)